MRRPDRGTPQALLWLAAAALGGVAGIMTSAVGLATILVAVPLLLTRDRWVGLSGFLVGFGAAWCMLIARQFAPGAERDGLVVAWLLVGLVPLVVGGTAASLLAIRATRSRGVAGR
ncbi:MAG: hypothetical protein U0667_16110 [Chloroflexota bacterium]